MIVIVGSVVTSVIGRDAFLYPATESLSSEFTESRVKIAEKPLGLDWSNK
jgi:thiamine pyrophosphate-dependent acetolactate synthase large subunit-like protein